MAENEADVVITWDFAPVPKAQQAMFSRPTLFLSLPTPANQGYGAQIHQHGPTPIRSLLQERYPNTRPLRIATLGFSQSCQGPRALLASGDGSRIDAVLCFDGIHTQFVPLKDKKSGKLDPSMLAPYVAYGRLAHQDGRLLLITTSDIVPPDFVSTTATSNWIWRQATGSENVFDDTPPLAGVWEHVEDPPFVSGAGHFPGSTQGWPRVVYDKAPSSRYRRSNGVVIFNYRNLDPTGHGDHVYQAQRVLPLMIQAYLVNRWNATDPSTGVCLLPS